MTRIDTLLRGADPAASVLTAPLGKRAEQELLQLVGDATTTPQSQTAAPRHPAPVARRQVLVTLAVGALVVAGSAVALTSVRHATPAGRAAGAERVVFEGSTASADERALEQVLSEDVPPDDVFAAFQRSLSRSPQLRIDAQAQFARYIRSSGRGSDVFPQDPSRDVDDSDHLVGGFQTGADGVAVVAMRCSGTGTYTWTAVGRTVESSAEGTIASFDGTCGPGVSASRFVLGSEQIVTAIHVTVTGDTRYDFAEFAYYRFGSPHLDSPYPTD